MSEIHFSKKTISTELPAFVMGIVNATPDSFYENSRGDVKRAFELIEQGADILDIGGESTRPGFTPVDIDVEIKRIVPLIKEIRKKSNVIISVDTRKADVAKACLEAGADIINDVSSLSSDEKMISVLQEYSCPIVIMHGFNQSEENGPGPEKIVSQVNDFFDSKIDYLLKQGIKKEDIILDPGIGFGKSFEENVALIKNCDQFCSKSFPFLMALSRKRCIGQITQTTVEERLTGTVCADLISVIKGAKIIRVHDVKEAVESLKIMKYMF